MIGGPELPDVTVSYCPSRIARRPRATFAETTSLAVPGASDGAGVAAEIQSAASVHHALQTSWWIRVEHRHARRSN